MRMTTSGKGESRSVPLTPTALGWRHPFFPLHSVDCNKFRMRQCLDERLYTGYCDTGGEMAVDSETL